MIGMSIPELPEQEDTFLPDDTPLSAPVSDVKPSRQYSLSTLVAAVSITLLLCFGIIIIVLLAMGPADNSSQPTLQSSAADSTSSLPPVVSNPLPASGANTSTPQITTAELPKGALAVGRGYFMGDMKSSNPVQVWEDLQCPYCAKFEESGAAPLRKSADIGKSSVEYFIASFIGQGSLEAANALGCAADQNKFYEFKTYAYAHQPIEGQAEFTVDQLKSWASPLDIKDVQKYTTCIDKGTYKDYATSVTLAMQKAGVRQTPTVVANGEDIFGLSFPLYLARLGLDPNSFPDPNASVQPSVKP